MVAVGDDEFLVFKRGGEQIDGCGVTYSPHTVNDLGLVGDFDIGCEAGVEEESFGAKAGIRIEHENLSEVGASGAKQVEAVAFRPGQSLFVAKDDLCGVVVKLTEGDETAALADNLYARSGIGEGKSLRIGEDTGFALLGKNAIPAPIGEIPGGAAVNILGPVPVKEFREAEDDAHQIERAALVIGLLHGGCDFVVRLGYYVVETDDGRIVAKRAKWINPSHFVRSYSDGRRGAGCYSMPGILHDCKSVPQWNQVTARVDEEGAKWRQKLPRRARMPSTRAFEPEADYS